MLPTHLILSFCPKTIDLFHFYNISIFLPNINKADKLLKWKCFVFYNRSSNLTETNKQTNTNNLL